MGMSSQIAKDVASLKISMDLAGLRVEDIHDAGQADLEEMGMAPEESSLVIELSVPYRGTLPDTGRALNALVMDWVVEHSVAISDFARDKVLEYLEETMPDVDLSELAVPGTDMLWSDQVDYFAGIDEEGSRIHFAVDMAPEFEDL